MIEIIAISGSLRAASTNSALISALAANAPDNCRIEIYDGIGRLPIFNPDDEGERTPPEAARLIEMITQADGVIVSCPEYAHGVPGGIKNALDWLVSRDAAVGKPAMLVHASTRSFYARAALAEVMRTMSFAIYEERALEIALLGKRPAEMEAILAEPASRQAMREAVQTFVGFIRGR
ncbi:NAD(P)H-dependent oxidoreductase [Mesorhizobium sp. M2D.F.Ca.ET.185.01.1.1]|uniref:NADPH-dependent FMN reductase n=1 Tax=unclassified Mesorhizobium TaxID=325217 RepID=UPI000FCADE4C|nr:MULTISPECIES: NADPH-dependent FMN reductase [unclassified Mesorhizobium]TGP75677.1 NAD(P)H-dependent oxidoreductase [bacterium M00.F.Ca.ET.227.01.1.1]TGP87159.1 NAD(P)H-dependent oxidoreductase [bacterium M00.F.Ca.ET.221.01.1.1]TGP91650.1 NAD(P)H-dependent oxidoreductase [bacterium M00.F.Ca.ET.222.01.1.1]TGT70047.1 NAD(P)H-dependent oxidoreductase [bacterium M00.F.Ca.ET.159.01.1.1]TGT81998.1 NAD(P)H-dependent oxidoreductase [bacterium M00.F.Ca.ET.157.01.1.1]TGU04095.1 NAD(P)H-dependent oxi